VILSGHDALDLVAGELDRVHERIGGPFRRRCYLDHLAVHRDDASA
jgi:hypothetical protein